MLMEVNIFDGFGISNFYLLLPFSMAGWTTQGKSEEYSLRKVVYIL